MNYQDFQLSRKRKDVISKHLAKKRVNKYVRQNGVEPTPEIEVTFYQVTPEEEEKYRKAFFANDFVEESELHIDMPNIINNTPEQDQVEETIVTELLNGNKTVVVEDVNNITLPKEVNVIANITGNFQNGATIESQSTKAMTIHNTSEDPIDISIIAKSTVYLTGKFNNIYFNGKSLNGSSSVYPEIYGEVAVVPPTTGSVNVYGTFQENSSVKYLGSEAMSVYNNNNENGNVTIYAPYSTVTVSGKYNNVEATVSDNTLILRYTFHAHKLKVNQGKVVYQGINASDFYDELIGESVEVEPYGFDVDSTNYTKISSTPGVYKFVDDFTGTTSVSFGIIASGKFKYDFNGHNVTFGRSNTGNIFLRGTASIDFVGEGSMTNNANSYGVWVSSENATVNVYGGEFNAYTHVMYAEKGTINIYGGTFNCLSEDKKFTLNCLDASYTAGTAHINVYGGKFYNFDPSHSMSEPGGPVSFVAEGYKVVSSQVGSDTIYEVVPE